MNGIYMKENKLTACFSNKFGSTLELFFHEKKVILTKAI